MSLLRAGENSRHGQQSQAGNLGLGGFHTVGITDLLSQHLIAAADADQGAPVAMGFEDGLGQPLAVHPGQVRNGGLGAGQDNQVGAAYISWRVHVPEGHAAFLGQGVEVVEVGDVGNLDHRDVQYCVPFDPYG